MKVVNLWESKQKDNYIYFTSIKEYLDTLRNKSTVPYLSFKEKYTLGEEPETYLETAALKSDITLIYTDKDHPIMYDPKGYIPTVINKSLFEENLPLFIEEARHVLINDLLSDSSCIYIPDYLYHKTTIENIIKEEHLNIPLSSLQDKRYYYVESSIPLPEEDIQNIKANHLEFNIKNKKGINKISTSILFGHYTLKTLQNLDNILLNIPLSNEEIENFIYISPNTKIELRFPYTKKQDELSNFYMIKHILEILSTHNNSYQITFEVDNRSLLKESKALSNIPSNVTLFIKSDLNTYDISTFTEEESKLDKLVAPIIEANLTPLERYLAVYDIVKKFKKYKENPNNTNDSRYLKYILDNEYIVCVGFSKLLTDLLRRVNIPVSDLSVGVDTSYDKNKKMDDTPLKITGHARNLIKIDDDKYNIHGIYIADSTWDNVLEEDYYLNSFMTFDHKKEADRLEELRDEDLLMDFHNRDELSNKVSYYIKRKISRQKNIKIKPDLKYIFSSIYDKILDHLKELDYPKYSYFYDKYNEKLQSAKHSYRIKDNAEEVLKIINEFLEEYYEYMLPLVNKEVSLNTIIDAASISKEKVNKLPPEELSTWINKTKKINEEELLSSFPYIYNPNNPTEAYLENKPHTL